MKRMFLIPLTGFALFIVGCTGNPSKVDTEDNPTEVDAPHVETEDHKTGLTHLTDEVKLDNGKKWTANPETNEGIDQMLARVKKEEGKETPDYVALKESLDEEFNLVLEKCTMKGESHDQLHNYLLPLKTKFGKLDTSSNKQAIEEVRDYLLTYHDYFK